MIPYDIKLNPVPVYFDSTAFNSNLSGFIKRNKYSVSLRGNKIFGICSHKQVMYEFILSIHRSNSKPKVTIGLLVSSGKNDYFDLSYLLVFRNNIFVVKYKLLKRCTFEVYNHFRFREVRPLGFESRRVGWTFLRLSLECSDMAHQLIILLGMLRNQCVLVIH